MVEKSVKIYSLPTYQVKPDVFLVYSDNVSKSKIPIIIDNGSYLCKAGWIVNEKPTLVFRNVAAKHRGKKESETQVGNDIKNIEAVRWLLKTQFDKNVVTQFDVQETILDYIFNHLGINSNGVVNHPIVMSEAVCNPNYSRQLMSELLFECYNVPQVSYGVDSLFSFYNYNAKSKGLFGLVVSLGYNTCHVLPLVRSRFDVRNAKRINIGTSNMDSFFHRILQLKYSAHASAITLSRAESLIREHMLFSQDFMEDIRMWEKENYAKDNTHTVQLPYVPLPGSNSNNNSGKMEKCGALLKRVQVMRLKQRSEKLAFDEEHLQECLSVQDLIEDGDDEAILALQELGYTSAAELQAGIKKLNCNIRKLKNLIAAQQDEPQESPFTNWCEELNLNNFTDADSWLNTVKLKRKEVFDARQKLSSDRLKSTNLGGFSFTTANDLFGGVFADPVEMKSFQEHVLTHVDSCCFKSKFYRKDLQDELKIFGMSSRHHIDDFMHGRIIGKIEEGRRITDVAREFDIAHSVVSRLWKSFKTTGMCSRRHGGGRVRSTTPAEDRYIVLSAKRNRHTTAQQVANQFLAASGKQISRKTVARRLRGGGLYARRPVVCVPLTRQHHTARLQWCREHHNWTEQDWACVLFSDESRFSLSSDCRRQLIWRESGTAYRPENIQEKDRYPTCSIMVWAGIMINGRTRLHVVANGTMTGQRYIDEVLLPHVRLFRGAVGDKFVFMDDNATCHRTLAVQDCLDSEGIQRLVWPARSPDLNPIENVWDALGRQVAGRNYPPTNKNTLIRALTEEWDKLPQQLLDNVVQSMVRRVECCITLHGGHIPY
ncbi:actin-related protein 5 [Trichonephila clavipes]|nr:actin-related protein 5 [Trichonephila clavipes]